MRTRGTRVARTDQLRGSAEVVGGGLLVALGLGSLALATVGLLGPSPGGVVYWALAVPPLAAGTAVRRRLPWARPGGFVVALAYGAVIAFVASTPWRPPLAPGQEPAVDPAATLVAFAFFGAAALLIIGQPRRRLVDGSR